MNVLFKILLTTLVSVKASAEGGTPIKMRVKGYKKYVETGNKAKTIEFDLDLSTKNIEEVKDILRELKE